MDTAIQNVAFYRAGDTWDEMMEQRERWPGKKWETAALNYFRLPTAKPAWPIERYGGNSATVVPLILHPCKNDLRDLGNKAFLRCLHNTTKQTNCTKIETVASLTKSVLAPEQEFKMGIKVGAVRVASEDPPPILNYGIFSSEGPQGFSMTI